MSDGGSIMRGDGGVFMRGRIAWIRYSAPGPDGRAREVRESSGSDSEATAERLLRKRLREVGNHRDGIQSFQGPAAERLVVADILAALFAKYANDRIKSMRQTTGHAIPIREFFGTRKALSVTPDLVRGYIDARRAEGASNATTNRELAVLKRAFTLAVQERRISTKPYIPSAGPEDNVRQGFFDKQSVERMVAELDPVMAEMTRFAFTTGWRASEVRLLTWSRIDRGAREIRLETSKNGRPRLLPLDEDLMALFDRRWSARQFTRKDGATELSEYVFHEKGKPLTESVFAKRWAAARERAGLPGRLFHDLRRSAVRNLIRSGVQEVVAMAISGHLTRSVFDRYNIVSTEDMSAALEKSRAYVSASGGNVEDIRR